MAGKKTEKPAGRGVTDNEVLTVEHDELLLWLLDHLKAIVSDRWGFDSSEASVALADARASALKWLGDLYGELAQFECGRRQVNEHSDGFSGESSHISAETKASIGAAMQRRGSMEQAIATCSATDLAGRAALSSYTVMKPVCGLEPRQYNDPRRVNAGFVDVVLEAFVPEGLKISLRNVKRDRGRHEYSFFMLHYTTDMDVRTTAEAMLPASVESSVVGDDSTIWISVRSDLFTLGEILQELKTLQRLEDGTQRVALLVNNIDERIRRNIEHEGFLVIARDDYSDRDLQSQN